MEKITYDPSENCVCALEYLLSYYAQRGWHVASSIIITIILTIIVMIILANSP